ncbi:MAG: hypothetical protein OEV35_10660, partial [Gallionellaceae bacterium]|nr:hypothetical protein [Gallionellaceae bacterium]
MPPTLSYPGVYIEEIPSGVRTISGVATSITAFIGRAKKGEVNEPHIINCFPDFEREFGGLWEKSYLGFAVRDFFQNGGSQAVIIRLYHSDNAPSKAVIEYDKIKLEAATEGAWGNNLSIRVDHDTKDPAKLFNLTVLDGGTGAREMIRNLSPASSTKRYVGDVLKYESKLIRLREVIGLPAKHPDPADSKYPDPFDSKNNPNCHS